MCILKTQVPTQTFKESVVRKGCSMVEYYHLYPALDYALSGTTQMRRRIKRSGRCWRQRVIKVTCAQLRDAEFPIVELYGQCASNDTDAEKTDATSFPAQTLHHLGKIMVGHLRRSTT